MGPDAADKALAELYAGVGTRYCRECVEAFDTLYRRGELGYSSCIATRREICRPWRMTRGSSGLRCGFSREGAGGFEAQRKNPAAAAGHVGAIEFVGADQENFLSATLSERPAARLRFIILRPCLVFMRARKPIERFLLIRLTRCG